MSDRLLPDWITAYMQYVENSEPPRIFCMWTALSTIAAALQRKVVLHWERPTYCNMFVVLVGPPGTRKGTAMNPAEQMLDDIGIKLSANATTRQALIKALSESGAMLVNEDTNSKLLFHSSITIFSGELAVFLDANDAQFIRYLCDWWDCKNKFEYDTVSRSKERINGVWVNLIGATTPEILVSLLPYETSGGGLLSRMIFAYGDKKYKLVPCPFPTTKELQLREKLVLDLERISTLKGNFSLSESWLDRYVPWYEESNANPTFTQRSLQYYNERRQTHLIKLCMLSSVSRSDSLEILEEDFDRAKKILVEAEQYMPKVFAGFGKNRDAEIMNRIMQTIGANKKVSFAELVRLYHQDADKETITRVLLTLQSMKYCNIVQAGKDSYIEYTGKGVMQR